jgi:hypothetical protein
MYFYY